MQHNYEYMKNIFKKAKDDPNAIYISIVFINEDMGDIPEILLIYRENFDYKLNYYLSAYDGKLKSKKNPKKYIRKILIGTPDWYTKINK